MESKKSFTGRARRKQNRWGVKGADACARVFITLGGLGTIVAIVLVFVCLFGVVWPLLRGAKVTAKAESSAPWTAQAIAIGVDEYRLLIWGLMPDGTLQSYQYSTGVKVAETKATEEGKITAISRAMDSSSVVLGFEDGSVRVGQIGPQATFPELKAVPEKLQSIKAGEQVVFDGGILERTAQGDLRLQKLVVKLSDPIVVAESAIRRLDHVFVETNKPVYHLLVSSEEGPLQLCQTEEKVNVLTEEVTYRVKKNELPAAAKNQPSGAPEFLALGALGNAAYVAWADGTLQRFNTRAPKNILLAEQLDTVDEPEARLTSMQMLLGRTTVITGDSLGKTCGWFVPVVEPPRVPKMVRAHTMQGPESAVTALAASATTRMLVTGYKNGDVCVYYVPTDGELSKSSVPSQAAIEHLVLTPKNDALLAVTSGKIWQADFDQGYPEASLTALFMPIWYENYEAPEHVWQSGGGSEDLEPKLGLVPLVFGTLKATTYSMLFGAPLALLAALYTSEFMHARLRSKIKPLIEMMASLPSVVLGFIAGLILAPYLETLIPATLAAFITVPLTLLIGAQLWQLLPQEISLRAAAWRIPLFLIAIPLGLWGAVQLGPVGERLLFGGNLRQWLGGTGGSSLGGWLIAVLPLSALTVAFFFGSVVNPWLRGVALHWSRPRAAVMGLVKFMIGLLVTAGLAFLISALLSGAGFDPRGSFIGKYDPRNALIVGFVMGFAIIPIIYTIADDALTTVPQHLRNGSYGCGATRWQTAVRIVIPTAMSGLFSAMMIGLGRAVGETMIVLMATGSTPVMDWNMFNGFRTLSANIAIEMPESAVGTTHYRVLFLAALVLFLLTFVVNTAAELVRNRFRKRAYQL